MTYFSFHVINRTVGQFFLLRGDMENIKNKSTLEEIMSSCGTCVDLRKKKGMHTKELIVLTAIHILFVEGRRALTASRLAKEAGVSKGNIYHHFKNMDSILEASFEFIITSAHESFKNVEYHDLSSFLLNIGYNLLDITKSEKEKTHGNPHIFWELVFDNEKLLALMREKDKLMNFWITTTVEKLIGKKLADEVKEYIINVSTNYMSGARAHVFLMGDNVDSYKRSWKLLAIHLEEKILEEK